MMDYVRLLQLIHVSDLHVVENEDNANTANGRDVLNRVFRPIPQPIRKCMVDKFLPHLQGHDSEAFEEFDLAIGTLLASEPEWMDKTQIVCTGDLSTWGDDESIEAALGELDTMAKNHGLDHFVIYGNHDVWPGHPPRIPWEASKTELDSRRSALRTPGHSVYGTHFGGRFPLHYSAARVPFQSYPGHLAVCALNTILHERLLNTLAIGYVGADRYWESHTTPSQLDELATRQAPEVRIVLTHHPVHEPVVHEPGFLKWLNGLINRGTAASNLAKPSSGYERTAYVVLSGHTHCQFPDHGALPTRAPQGSQRHVPLDDDQVQLITGTLSQRSFDDDKHEHVFQVLRFYEEMQGHHILIGRITFTRSSGTGPFQPLGLSSGNTEEFMVLPV